MQFPVYQVPLLGNGMVIGFNATVHVLVSHGIAIGLLAMVVLTDWFNTYVSDAPAAAWESFKRHLLLVSVFAVTTIGPLTGVGIWLTTSALAPRAIGSMLRIFFWSWFAEWIVFVLELAGVLLYCFLWDRLAGARRPRRVLLGAFYVLLSASTAVLITANLGFMLTPGHWPAQRSFSTAFWNPTFLPQLIYRLALGVFLGSLFAGAIALFKDIDPTVRRQATRLYASVMLGSLAVLGGALVWYFQAVPKAYSANTSFSVLTSRLSQSPWLLGAVNAATLLCFVLCAALLWMQRVRPARWMVVSAIVFAAGFTAEFERIREFIRGPYLLPGYMYVNGLLLEEHPRMTRQGMLENDHWFQRTQGQTTRYEQGARLFAQNCSACHTINGINSIRRRVNGRSEDGIYVLAGRTHELTSFMPPFSGTANERRSLAHFLYSLTPHPTEGKEASKQ